MRLLRLNSSDGRLRRDLARRVQSAPCIFSLPQRILTREQLLDLTRMNSSEVYDRSIDVQIMRLPRKIETDPSLPQFIRAERGVGYYFDAQVTALR